MWLTGSDVALRVLDLFVGTEGGADAPTSARMPSRKPVRLSVRRSNPSRATPRSRDE
jgi:hypothetical protein